MGRFRGYRMREIHHHNTERSQVRRNRLFRWAAIPLGAAVAIVLAGCSQAASQGFLPGTTETTNHTGRIINLWTGSWVILLGVGVITWSLIIWAAVVYRRRRGQTGFPVQMRYNMPLEILYTGIPLILVLGFFAFTARDQAAIEERIEDPDVQIQVYGKRWGWDFNYVDEDVYFQGTQTQEQQNGNDVVDDSIPVLYLPVGQSVEIKLDSRDVAHSFWVLDFLYKKDVYPSKSNYMYFVPQEEGVYMGKCAELCGEFHSLMLFKVAVVSEEEYEAYTQSLRDAGNVGQVGNELDAFSTEPGTGAPGDGELAPEDEESGENDVDTNDLGQEDGE